MRDGRAVPQFTLDRLSDETPRFSHMIADRGYEEPGYTKVACFDDIKRGGRAGVMFVPPAWRMRGTLQQVSAGGLSRTGARVTIVFDRPSGATYDGPGRPERGGLA